VKEEEVLGANGAAEEGEPWRVRYYSRSPPNRLYIHMCRRFTLLCLLSSCGVFLVTKLNVCFSDAPSLAFGFGPSINEYSKPYVIWLLQFY